MDTILNSLMTKALYEMDTFYKAVINCWENLNDRSGRSKPTELGHILGWII